MMLLIIGVIPSSIAGLVAYTGPGRVHPAAVLTLMVGAATLILLLRAWGVRSARHVDSTANGDFLRTGRTASAETIPFDTDGFLIRFTRDDRRHRSVRTPQPPDQRAILLAREPWPRVEISLTRKRPPFMGLDV